MYEFLQMAAMFFIYVLLPAVIGSILVIGVCKQLFGKITYSHVDVKKFLDNLSLEELTYLKENFDPKKVPDGFIDNIEDTSDIYRLMLDEMHKIVDEYHGESQREDLVKQIMEVANDE